MKYSILVLAITAFSFSAYADESNEYVRAAKVKMSTEDCERLAVEASIVAFSPDNNSYYSLANLNKGKSVEFFNNTRKQINEKYKAYCKDGKSLKTIEEFTSLVNSTCGSTCDSNLDVYFKDSILGASKEKQNAEIVCLAICNETSKKMGYLGNGARLSEKQRAPAAAPDCSGAFSNLGRSDKAFINDVDKLNKETAKKAAQK